MHSWRATVLFPPLSDSCFQANASSMFLSNEKRGVHPRFKFGTWQNHASLPGGPRPTAALDTRAAWGACEIPTEGCLDHLLGETQVQNSHGPCVPKSGVEQERSLSVQDDGVLLTLGQISLAGDLRNLGAVLMGGGMTFTGWCTVKWCGGRWSAATLEFGRRVGDRRCSHCGEKLWFLSCQSPNCFPCSQIPAQAPYPGHPAELSWEALCVEVY